MTDEPEAMYTTNPPSSAPLSSPLLFLSTALHRPRLDLCQRKNAQFPLHQHRSRPDDPALPPGLRPAAVQDAEQVVFVVALAHPVVALVPLFFRDVADRRQHAQHVQEAVVVVASEERSDRVVFRQLGGDGGGDEGGGEERVGGHGGGCGGWEGGSCGALPMTMGQAWGGGYVDYGSRVCKVEGDNDHHRD